MRSVVMVSALLTVLAGCTDGGGGAEGGSGPHGGGAAVEAPQWEIGDHWSFDNMGSDGGASSTTIVVTGESGGEWIVDTNEPEHALFHAREPVSYLGEVRKSDLAGSQGGDRVQFFDFPLEANKTWTTTWDGLRVDLEVRHVFDDGRVHIVAMADGRTFAEYEYSSAAGFFEYIDFYDDNGTKAFEMDLSDHGSDFTGTVYRYDIQDMMVFDAADAAMEHQELDFGEGVNEVWIHSIADCGGAAAGQVGSIVTHRAPEEQFVPQLVTPTQEMVHSSSATCATDQDDAAADVVDVDPERVYDVEYGVAAQGGTIHVMVEPRILEAIVIGAAA